MKQQNILWIIFFVAFSAIIVVVFGIILLQPPKAPTAEDALSAGTSPTNLDPVDFLNGNGEIPEEEGAQIPEEEEMEVSADKYVPEEAAGYQKPASMDDIKPDIKTSDKPSQKTSEKSAQPAKTAAAEREAKETVQASVKKTEDTKSAEVKKEPQMVKEYWIQLASFSSMSRAEAGSEDLAEKGLATRIFTTQIEGKTWYRLRNGPYSDKAEAEKFLEWVRAIPTLGESLISEVTLYR